MIKEQIIESLNNLKKRYFLLKTSKIYLRDKSFRAKEQLTKKELAFEDSILGTMMIEPRIFYKTYNHLISESIFFNAKNQIIFEATIRLFNASEAMGVKEVVNELIDNNNLDTAGGEDYVFELYNKAFSFEKIYFIEEIVSNNPCPFLIDVDIKCLCK